MHRWTRLNFQTVSNEGERTHICSFIYPALKINNKRIIIHNSEELKEFLKENPTVPHDRSNHFDNCDSKNPRNIWEQDLQAMLEDLFNEEEPADIKEIKVQKYKAAR